MDRKLKLSKGREKVWNIQLVVDEIIEFPQTYNSILQEEYKNGTCQLMLRKKLNILVKEGTIFKMSVPGTRFGKCLFYCPDKTYYILIESGRLGSIIYAFYDYKKVSKLYIKLNQYWELVDQTWQEKKDKTIFEGNVLTFI